jgi:Fur family transcriptional regulator, peroxide stress response regulator
MNRPSARIATKPVRVEDALRRAGLKRTPQRLEIYRLLAETGDHPDIETIYRNTRRTMTAISLDTVYRTLDLFRELGLVTTVRPRPDRVRFDANTDPHHHFICEACGSISDFEDRTLDDWPVPEAARALGFVRSARVDILGLCPNCVRAKKTAKKQSMRRD